MATETYVQATAKERSREQVLENNVITVSKITGTNPMYYKVTVTKPSTLEFQFFGYQGLSGTIALCNKNKKVISAISMIGTDGDTGEQIYVMDKGTYYYKFTTKNQKCQVLSTIKPYTDKVGTSIQNPKELQKGQVTTGYVSLNDKKGAVDYYKLTVKEDGDCKGLYFGFDGQGSVKITVKIPGYKKKVYQVKSGLTHSIHRPNEPLVDGTHLSTVFPKGTYTITVKKLTAKTNGSYYIGKTKVVNQV